ncbi:zinc finger, CCHC-type containing protein, partial [Tanacetum coccineum]
SNGHTVADSIAERLTRPTAYKFKTDCSIIPVWRFNPQRLNIVNDIGNSAFMSTFKLNDLILWHARLGHVHFKRMQDISKDRLISAFDMDTEKSFQGFRFYVIKPNELVSINSIIESNDADFDDNRFSSVHRPSQRSLINRTEDIDGLVVPKEVTEEVVTQQTEPELRKGKRNKTLKNCGPEFQLYLIKGTRDEDVALWKEAINDEMDSIMGNNTWVLADLPQGFKPLGYKWIFKRKLKVDETIEKFKARLVIQGFRQKSWIDYFDTFALVAHISTIRLLIAMTSILNLIIFQMDVKTTFLNGKLDEEVYMNQPQGFIMHDNENKEFLSSKFSIKDMKEADVILSIRTKHESNGLEISQSHYIKKVLKKFNYFDFTLVSTPMDTSEKLMPNNGEAVSQLEYSRVIGCMMYAMTCTRPDIAFVVGNLSSYTSNPSNRHWQAIQWVSKYLKKTIDYSLIYTGYPSVFK